MHTLRVLLFLSVSRFEVKLCICYLNFSFYAFSVPNLLKQEKKKITWIFIHSSLAETLQTQLSGEQFFFPTGGRLCTEATALTDAVIISYKECQIKCKSASFATRETVAGGWSERCFHRDLFNPGTTGLSLNSLCCFPLPSSGNIA